MIRLSAFFGIRDNGRHAGRASRYRNHETGRRIIPRPLICISQCDVHISSFGLFYLLPRYFAGPVKELRHCNYSQAVPVRIQAEQEVLCTRHFQWN